MISGDFEWRDSEKGPIMEINIKIPVLDMITKPEGGFSIDFEEQGFRIIGNISIMQGDNK